MNSGIACLAYLNPGIACLASQSYDWLGALWASLSGVQSRVTFVRLNVIGHCWGGTFNCPASTHWLIDCALAHMGQVGNSKLRFIKAKERDRLEIFMIYIIMIEEIIKIDIEQIAETGEFNLVHKVEVDQDMDRIIGEEILGVM